MKHKIPTTVYTYPESASQAMYDDAADVIVTTDRADAPIAVADVYGRPDLRALRDWIDGIRAGRA